MQFYRGTGNPYAFEELMNPGFTKERAEQRRIAKNKRDARDKEVVEYSINPEVLKDPKVRQALCSILADLGFA